MKKLFIIILVLLAATRLQAQVVFKMAYQPKTTYTINKETKTNMTMKAPEALAAVAGGADITSLTTMRTTSVITTGAAAADKMMPFKFSTKTTDIKVTMNGRDMPADALPLDNTAVYLYGKYSPDKIVIDSVSGQQMADSLKAAMSKLVDAAQNGVKFPDRPLKVGDTFAQDMPLTVPVPGMAATTVNVKMNYTLVSITGNIAVFDFTETMDIAMKQTIQNQGLDMKVNGFGNGKLTYDLTRQFFTTMTNNMTTTFDVQISTMSLQGKGIINTVDKVDIAGN